MEKERGVSQGLFMRDRVWRLEGLCHKFMVKDYLRQFRSALYGTFTHRADAIFDLLDALTSDALARSPIELSMSPLPL